MAVKKTKAPKRVGIEDLEGADRALLKLAQAGLYKRRLEDAAQLRINDIKNKLQQDTAPFQAEIEALDEDLLQYAIDNRSELFGAGKKSVDLPFGKLTSRETSKIVIKSTDRTVELLRDRQWNDAIVVKETPNKDILAGYTDEDLKSVGAKRVVEDVIAYKVDEEKAALEMA